MKAIISSYNRARGYGFATPQQEDLADIFFHASKLPKDHRFAKPGEVIEFDLDIKQGDPRPVAVNIRFVSAEELEKQAGSADDSK